MAKLKGGTLAIDVGGTGIKGMVLDPSGKAVNERVRLETPRPAEPERVLATIVEVARAQPGFERVSIGFPGVVVSGVVETAPNLDGDWRGFRLADRVAESLEKPTRAANDADVQGLGTVDGVGVEMVLTLGTGLGSALFVNGRLVPNLELGHHPFRKGRTYEDLLSNAELGRIGKKKWNRRVRRALDQIMPIWNPDLIYLGGGNARKLEGELPPKVKVSDNVAGILGGIKLWL
ncbi:MAG: ROK family protein [Deltaproteobacteria bacterium]|nr:ROK family protein [Deltaproteobacteria bacterium]